ncbi:trypsin-like peptidase domain-containing protein [Actinosynnema sp. NPDC047251]|uniref:Peptidase, S1/S6 family n=1 Tax=Saccharothrix espanaensis (strain ATCC 51144 / DSM 44229 / JCM 9112 / NBRC 15066 / NRRL 15764) TaxID=1179773 RepID=K0KB06_SACES|nr:trypsin-like peptidase domain-containing protein [Saccharothrix espanaensis]CCH34707.1 Peptidase, S1/S6 family [Saccharothrix espanaensis DSM 44229]
MTPDFPAMSGSLHQAPHSVGPLGPLGHRPQPAAPAPKPFWRRTGTVVTSAALIAALFGGVTGGVVGAMNAPDPTVGTAGASVALQTSNQSTVDVSAIAAKVLPSVVQVNVATAQGQGIGSGVVLSADGRILTNNHVVSGAQQVSVTLDDGRTVDAKVLGTDPTSDLAVVQAQGVSGLTPAAFADSDGVKIGDQVVAIGSPEGLQGTVTSGIVSALDRKVTVPGETRRSTPVNYQAIQTDASINPGNSGGPLINAAGQVVGINSAIYSPASDSGSAGSVGIGFAIPANQAKQIADQLT